MVTSVTLKREILQGGGGKMVQLSTFEEIFNKLYEDYKGEKVNVISKQDGVKIASFQTCIDRIDIKPLNKRQSKKWNKNGEKIGLIIIKEKCSNNNFNIPFLLGFNTMRATFLKNGVIINSLKMEFVIKKPKFKNKLLA